MTELGAPAADPRAGALGAKHSRLPLSAGPAPQILSLYPEETSLETAAAIYSEVMLFLDQAGVALDKNADDASATGIIPAISDRVVPVDLRKAAQPLRAAATQGTRTASAASLVVTVQANLIGGEVQGYVVLEAHASFPRERL